MQRALPLFIKLGYHLDPRDRLASWECRGQSPVAGPSLREGPASKVPQEWGFVGVEKTFVNALDPSHLRVSVH